MKTMPARFLQACRRGAVDATPVWFMRQAGRYMASYRRIRERHTILEICERPELTAEVTLQPVRRLGVDAAILFADILLPVRPLGLRLEFRKGEGPALLPPVRNSAAVSKLRKFDPATELGFVMEAIRLIRKELAREAAPGRAPVPLIGFAGAPFTLASYIIEGGPSEHYIHTKRMMHSEPATWDRLMNLLSEVTADYLRAQITAGAQAVQLFDSWVGALSAADYRRFVKPYSRRVLDAVRRTRVPSIHFGTGTSGFLEDFSDAGGDVVSVDWRIPLDRAWSRIGTNRAIQGNLDPILLLLPPRCLREEVRRILREARGRRGHIFNLGHGVLPSTPEANVKAVVDWVHEWRAR